jgi:signal transduction histidine kinase/ligand-binding sensor domain-containing protein/CheY-like chemotaxis protein
MVTGIFTSSSRLYITAISILLLLGISYPYKTLALNPQKSMSQYAIDVWQEKEGLPQITVNVILQTKDSYLLIGTNEGLYRFDGVKFSLIKDNEFNQNEVYALVQDLEGGVWIGYRGGLARLKDKKIKIYNNKDGFHQNTVKALQIDKEGSIWIGSYANLTQFINGKFIDHKNDKGEKITYVKTLYCDNEGYMWFGGDHGLFQYKNGKIIKFNVIDKKGKEARNYTYISGDSNGTVWITTKLSKLIKYKAGEFTVYDFNEDEKTRITLNSVRVDADGNVWIGTRQKGLCRLENGNLVPYHNPNITFLMSDVISLCNDLEGSLWVGTQINGLLRLRDIGVTAYTPNSGLVGNRVSSVFEDSNKNIWIGTSEGVSSITNNGITFYQNKSERFLASEGLVIYSIIESIEGTILVGTSEGIFELKNGKFSPSFQDITQNREVRDIYIDQDRGMWISLRNEGLLYLKDGSITRYHNDKATNYRIKCILTDRQGFTWFSSPGKGIGRIKDGKIVSDFGSDTLGDKIAASLHEDKEGTMWIATPSGLVRYKDNQFKKFTVEDGLPTGDLVKILEDDNNNLWIGTSSIGIFRLSKQELDDFSKGRVKTLHPLVYSTIDGLPANNCMPSGVKTKDGKLWFGTVKGVISIDPNNLQTNHIVPPVYIEELFVDKKSIDPKDGIRIKPGHGDIEIRYTGLSYLIPERVYFKYKLEGFDHDWTEAGTRRAAYYTNLPPGHYKFQVMACNNDGVWNLNPTTISFTLLPHFYQTAWFYILCGLSFSALSWTLYQLRVRHLQKARDAALEASRLKSSFLTTISHELRTPLNGVIGMSNLLMETKLSSEQVEYAETIRSSSEALLSVINDILDFTRIEAGKIELQKHDFNLKECVEETISFLAVGAHSKNLVLTSLIYSDVPILLCGDKGRLRQIISNLVGNAIKFTDHGHIAVRVSKIHETSSHTTIRCEITDTGIGITKEDQAKLFNLFTQLDGSAARKYEGTGLGLSISKQLVERLDGKIGVVSEKGEGSTFWFTAKFEKQQGKQIQLASNRKSINLRALILSETEIVREALQHYCMQWGIDEYCLFTHEDAIELLKEQAEKNQAFDLLIIETAGNLNKLEELGNSIRSNPLINRTKLLAIVPPSHKLIELKLNNGEKIDTLTTPVKQDRLFESLSNIKIQRSPDIKISVPIEIRELNNSVNANNNGENNIERDSLKILLAEDNLVNQKVAIRMLQNLGYRAKIVENGKQVLEVLSKEEFDIILMDCMMPEMDGYEATREIRKRENGIKHTKIIAMTANALVGDREKCLEVGMDDYLSKPVKSADLDKMIKHWASVPHKHRVNIVIK